MVSLHTRHWSLSAILRQVCTQLPNNHYFCELNSTTDILINEDVLWFLLIIR